MSLRTPNTTQTRQTLLDLERTKDRLATNQSRISSGKRLASPGDDPTAAAAILSFENSIGSNTQFVKQADAAVSLMSNTEDVVAAVIDQVVRLTELAQTGSAASMAEVNSIKDSLISLGNTNQQGKYLFSGTQTQTIPFTKTAGGASYAGDAAASGAINLVVGGGNSTISSIQVQTNVTGETVFGVAGSGTDLFKAVTDLSNALSNPASVPSTQTIIGTLQTIFNNLNTVRTDLGGKQAGLIAMKDMLTGFNTTLQGMQSAQEDTNYPQAITDYTSDQTVQQAGLSALAKANKNNLFDYLA